MQVKDRPVLIVSPVTEHRPQHLHRTVFVIFRLFSVIKNAAVQQLWETGVDFYTRQSWKSLILHQVFWIYYHKQVCTHNENLIKKYSHSFNNWESLSACFGFMQIPTLAWLNVSSHVLLPSRQKSSKWHENLDSSDDLNIWSKHLNQQTCCNDSFMNHHCLWNIYSSVFKISYWFKDISRRARPPAGCPVLQRTIWCFGRRAVFCTWNCKMMLRFSRKQNLEDGGRRLGN